MIELRTVVRSDSDALELFKVSRVCYPESFFGEQAPVAHCHPKIEVSLITAGSGCYSCAGKDYPFSPGDVFLHCSNDLHYFRYVEEGEDLSLSVLQFEPRLLWTLGADWLSPRYLRIFTEGSPVPRKLSSLDPEGLEIGSSIRSCCEACAGQEPAYDLKVKAKLLEIIACFARAFGKEISSAPLLSEENLKQMEEVSRYIHANLDRALSLEELAARAHLSKSYFSALFRTLNGSPVWNYILELRIEKAQFLLESSRLPVTEICGNCGFANLSNFNRRFKAQTGMTPKEYRKAFQEVKNES